MGTYLQYFDPCNGNLPPGFRFHPTDEELITYYLLKKVLDGNFSCRAIAEVDLNKCEPWELPEKAKMGEKEWYFFSLRDRKYPTGLRTNRATEAGYWKATGKDREIYSSKTCCLVGMKKTLVFYRGRAPKGEKTHWVMHEYRLDGKFSYRNLSTTSKDEWVISRMFQKSGSAVAVGGSFTKTTRINSGGVNLYPEASSPSCSSLPPLLDSSPFAAATTNSYDSSSAAKEHVPCFSNTNFYPHAPFDSIAAKVDPSATACFPRSNGGSGLHGFPNLKSLQENLQIPFFFSALAPPPVHGGGDTGGCNTFGGWLALEDQKVDGGMMNVGPNELDCLWGF